MAFLRGYLISFLMVFVIAALLFLLMIANAVLSAIVSHFQQLQSSLGNPIVNWLVLWFITTLLFGMIYRLLPDRPVDWRDVWLGAAITSILFSGGSWLIGIYLVHVGVGSVYGRRGLTGSLVDVALLLGSGLPLRRRVDQSLCHPTRALYCCRIVRLAGA